jgi:outer membrane protein OmpA-like peptidoglycan-associated protein
MSRLRKPSAIALASVVLLGIPYVLLWHLSWPQLDLSWSSVLVHLRGLRLPPGVGTALLIVLLWTLWGLYLAGLVVEGAARVRGTSGLIRPLGPLQVVAATAVGATVVAPAYALADTTADESATEGQQAPGRQDGAPAAAPAAEEAPGSVERERVVAGFATGSADLTEGMRADLEPVVELLRDHGDPDAPVRITGHTDPTGDARTNLELSERRAQAVADHLAAELGDRAPETEVEGVGSSEQREGDHADQRRVELVYTVRTGPPEQASGDTGEEESETAGSVAAEAVEDDVAAGDAGDGDAATAGEEVALASASDRDGQDAEEDAERVVVLEVPDSAVTVSAAFAGVLGGYVLARGGARLPRAVLSLPRPRSPFGRGSDARLALPPVPPRPTPRDEIDDRVSVELGHVPGIGLTGAGMKGAARRLLVNALDASDSGVARVVITEEDTVWLVGERGRDLLGEHPCEPVRMVAGMEEALAVLQRELYGAADEALVTDEPAPLVLIARPEPRYELELSALLLHGQHRGISAVLLGRWPLGGSCVVEEDGLITETSTPLNPIFHHSWPGSDSDDVLRAVRAHRHSRPAEGTRGPAEDESSAAVAEPLTEPETDAVREPGAEPTAAPAPRRTPAEVVALSGFWDSLVENTDTEPNAFWADVPELGETAEPGAAAESGAAPAPSDRRTSEPASEVEPGPEAKPEPGTQPEPEAVSIPELDVVSAPPARPRPESKSETGPQPEPETASEPAPEIKSEPGSEAEAASASEPDALSAPPARPRPEKQTEPERASEAKPAPEPEAKPEPEPAPAARPGPEAKPAPAPEPAPEAVPGSDVPAADPSPWREPATASSAQAEPAPTPGSGASARRVATARAPERKERGERTRATEASAPQVRAQTPAQAPAAPRPQAKAQARAETQTAPDAPDVPDESAEETTTSRPLPAKPRKAGRGRTWRPKERP